MTQTGSTTSLILHLRDHPAEYNFYQKLKDEQPRVLINRPQKKKIQDFLTKPLTRSISKMMALDFQPYTIVEDKEFKQSLALTTDMWTSWFGDGYISLICNFITSSFHLKKNVLNISHFLGSHGLPVYVVSDNACSIRSVISNSGCEHIPCFDHLLQFAISDAKKGLGINDVLAAAVTQTTVTYYGHSNVARERLHAKQKQGGVPNHELIQMVGTHWNSEYHMQLRLLEQKQFVIADDLTSKEWKMAEGMVQVLQPINDATLKMNVDRIRTWSMVIQILHGIENVLKIYIVSSQAGMAIMFAKQLKLVNIPRESNDHRFKYILLEKHEKDLEIHRKTKEATEVMKHDTHHVQNVSSEVELKAATDYQLRTFLRLATVPRTENPLKRWCTNAI
ncbi:hypothetical protein PR048_006519 [Dryococelus australis]|uniref:Transposase n=1 Tax=Dryococelus australis TaxID=614101 RepID=A0ABQ9IDF9_9NEOP|nr:hypothetical protein PR048_006519 [Dryococelus australis]